MRTLTVHTGQLWKRQDKWFIKIFDEEGKLISEHPVSKSSIEAEEKANNVCYGNVEFRFNNTGLAVLNKKVQVTLHEGAILNVHYKVLSRLKEFFTTKTDHKTFHFIDFNMESILHTLSDDVKIYPRLSRYREQRERYKILDRVRKTLPRLSNLPIAKYVEKEMNEIIHEVFLETDI